MTDTLDIDAVDLIFTQAPTRQPPPTVNPIPQFGQRKRAQPQQLQGYQPPPGYSIRREGTVSPWVYDQQGAISEVPNLPEASAYMERNVREEFARGRGTAERLRELNRMRGAMGERPLTEQDLAPQMPAQAEQQQAPANALVRPQAQPRQPMPQAALAPQRFGFGQGMETAPDTLGIDALDLFMPKNFGTPSRPRPAADPSAPPVNTAADMAQSTGIGLVQGTIGIAGLPSLVEQGGRWLANKGAQQFGATENVVAPDPVLPTYSGMKQGIEGLVGQKFYEPKTVAGEYARTIGEFAPGMLIPGGAASMAGRAATNVLAPALLSESAGQVTKGTTFEPYARVAGGLVGGMIRPRGIGAERQAAANVLKREGIETTAGQQTGNSALRWAEAAAMDTPAGGSRLPRMMERQAEQFTAAALKRAGVKATRATPDVLDDAFTTLGKQFDDMAKAVNITPSRWSPKMRTNREMDIRRIGSDYLENQPAGMKAEVIGKVTDELADMVATGKAIDGKKYQSFRTRIDRAQRGTSDVATSRALLDIKNWLDDMATVGFQGKPDVIKQWKQTRREYRNLLAIEKAALGAGEDVSMGLLSPALVARAAKQMGKRDYVRGKGDFAELARAGQAMLKPLPQSGTAPRATLNTLGTILGAGIGGSTAATPGAIAGAIAGPAIAARAVGSRPVQAFMRTNPGIGFNPALIPGLEAQRNKGR